VKLTNLTYGNRDATDTLAFVVTPAAVLRAIHNGLDRFVFDLVAVTNPHPGNWASVVLAELFDILSSFAYHCVDMAQTPKAEMAKELFVAPAALCEVFDHTPIQ